MSNRVFKNTQVSMGSPFQLKSAETDFIPVDEVLCREVYLENFDEMGEENEKDVSAFSEQILAKAREEADAIIKNAEARCDQLMKEAEEKAYDLMYTAQQEAYKQGYEEGYNKAYNETLEKSRGLLKSIMEIRERANDELEKSFARLEPEVIALTLDIAKAVVMDELSSDSNKLISIMQDAVGKCSNKEALVLKVSEKDYDFVLNSRERLAGQINGTNDMEIRLDTSLSRGSCIVESKLGIIDASIDTKIAKIREAFMQMAGETD